MTTADFNKYNTNSIVEIDTQIQGGGSMDIQIYREEGVGVWGIWRVILQCIIKKF